MMECPFCDFIAENMYRLCNHVKRDHLDRVNNCPYCDTKCKNAMGVARHIAYKHPNKKYDKHILVRNQIEIEGI